MGLKGEGWVGLKGEGLGGPEGGRGAANDPVI